MEWFILIAAAVVILAVVAGSRPPCSSSCLPPPRHPRPHPEEIREAEIKIGDAEAAASSRSRGPLLRQLERAFREMDLWICHDLVHRKYAVPRDWIQGDTIVVPSVPVNLPPTSFSTAHGEIFDNRMLTKIDEYRQKVRIVQRTKKEPPLDLVWLDEAQYHLMRKG